MKILFGMPAKDSWGGPIACEPPFVDALREQGVDAVEEIYVYGEKDSPTPLFERIRRVIATALRFRRLASETEFDVIHLNTAFDLRTILRDTVSIFLMRRGRAKLFLKLHGSDAKGMSNANFVVRMMIRYLIKHVDGFGLLSSEEKDAFLKLGFPPEKLFLVKNALVMPGYNSESRVRTEKESSDTFELLFVSRFMPAKGLIETIRACATLKSKAFSFTLHCIGNGEVRADAESEAKRLGIAENVKFTGYIPEAEVTGYLQSSDIFVFPTRHIEGLPLALFKAAAAGMPIVTTRIRAAADHLNEPQNCLFCSVEPENIAARIIELIENKELRRRMGENNLSFGEALSPAKIAGEYLPIYRLLSGE